MRVPAQNPATRGDKNGFDCTSIPLVRGVVKWLASGASATVCEIVREDAAAPAALDPVDAGLEQEAREF